MSRGGHAVNCTRLLQELGLTAGRRSTPPSTWSAAPVISAAGSAHRKAANLPEVDRAAHRARFDLRGHSRRDRGSRRARARCRGSPAGSVDGHAGPDAASGQCLEESGEPARAVFDRMRCAIGCFTAIDVIAYCSAQPASCMAGTASLHMAIAPRQLSSRRRTYSRSVVAKLPGGGPPPLVTRMSSPPSALRPPERTRPRRPPSSRRRRGGWRCHQSAQRRRRRARWLRTADGNGHTVLREAPRRSRIPTPVTQRGHRPRACR